MQAACDDRERRRVRTCGSADDGAAAAAAAADDDDDDRIVASVVADVLPHTSGDSRLANTVAAFAYFTKGDVDERASATDTARDSRSQVRHALRVYALRELNARAATTTSARARHCPDYDPVIHLLLLLLAGDVTAARHLAERALPATTGADADDSREFARYYDRVGEPLSQRDYRRFFAQSARGTRRRDECTGDVDRDAPAPMEPARARDVGAARRALLAVLRRAVMRYVLALTARAYCSVPLRQVAHTLALTDDDDDDDSDHNDGDGRVDGSARDTAPWRLAVVRICTAAPLEWRADSDTFTIDDGADVSCRVSMDSLWPARWRNTHTIRGTAAAAAAATPAADLPSNRACTTRHDAIAAFEQLVAAERALGACSPPRRRAVRRRR